MGWAVMRPADETGMSWHRVHCYTWVRTGPGEMALMCAHCWDEGSDDPATKAVWDEQPDDAARLKAARRAFQSGHRTGRCPDWNGAV